MPRVALFSTMIAAAFAISFTALDYLVLDDVIPNHGPKLDLYNLVKTIAAAAVAFIFVFGIYHGGAKMVRLQAFRPLECRIVMISLALSAIFVQIFVISPTAFNRWGSEDALIENLAAVFAMAGAICFAGAALTALRLPNAAPNRKPTIILSCVCAITMFLLCMEEISWGQRIFQFSTPDSFSGNLQGEVNLHNFYTTPVHTVYRLGGWSVLILLPFISAFGPRLEILEKFEAFVPPAWVAAMSAPVACFNYNAWPFFPTQVVVFSSCIMMLIFWRHARQNDSRTAIYYAASGLLMVAAQAVFITFGDRFVRLWDVTEYQEFFIALGLATVGWVVWDRLLARTRMTPQRASGEVL